MYHQDLYFSSSNRKFFTQTQNVSPKQRFIVQMPNLLSKHKDLLSKCKIYGKKITGFVEMMIRRCGLISPSRSRRYLPVLRDFPAKFIYDPWNAPEDVQVAAGCVIGVDYPKPMVNHAEASRLNIERMRQIYQQLSRYRGLSKTLFKSRNVSLSVSLPCLILSRVSIRSAVQSHAVIERK